MKSMWSREPKPANSGSELAGYERVGGERGRKTRRDGHLSRAAGVSSVVFVYIYIYMTLLAFCKRHGIDQFTPTQECQDEENVDRIIGTGVGLLENKVKFSGQC